MSIHEVLAGTRQWWIEEGDAGVVLAGLPEGCASALIVDPPWQYFAGKYGHGCAEQIYATLPLATIAEHLTLASKKVSKNAYLMLWCTFPKVAEWMRYDPQLLEAGWRYITGGVWGKSTGLGIGYHMRGDAELILFYAKGKIKPQENDISNLWITPRLSNHSYKPESVLTDLVRISTKPGDLVLDVYAGNSGNLARVCQRLGRRYIGVEIDSKRRAEALARLSQQELELVG